MFKDIYILPYKNLTFKTDNICNDIRMREKSCTVYIPCFESKSFS